MNQIEEPRAGLGLKLPDTQPALRVVPMPAEVFAERHDSDLESVVKVTEAQLVYVAVDAQGKKRDIK
jgi:acyl-CoA hydrolase